MADDDRDLHPVAREIGDRLLQLDAAGLDVVPESDVARWQADLLQRRADRRLFEHLAVLSLRLSEGKRVGASAQLRDLALLGLTSEGLKDVIERAEARPRQAREGRAPLGDQPAGGLGLRRRRRRG